MDGNSEALLISLSRYLRPAISLPSMGVSEPISETLATFADSRHRVGPLLHMAWQNCADITADKNASAILETSYQVNVYVGLRQRAVERKISNLLVSHAVPFSFLKGRGLAEQLHDDPAARQSKDIDILLAPGKSRQAIKLLNDEGYIFKSHTLRHKDKLEPVRQDMELKLFKDITFIDPALSVPIELHGRLFKFEPKGLTNDFNDSVKSAAIPPLSNSFYCLYLIMHGSLAMWPRLKWLVDLSIMARKMPVQNRVEMMDIAKIYGCEVAIAASMLMAEEMFSGSLDDDWRSLLKPFQKDQHLRKLQGLYYECLAASAVGRPSYPLKSFLLSGAADLVFPGKIGMLETLFKRFINSLVARI